MTTKTLEALCSELERQMIVAGYSASTISSAKSIWKWIRKQPGSTAQDICAHALQTIERMCARNKLTKSQFRTYRTQLYRLLNLSQGRLVHRITAGHREGLNEYFGKAIDDVAAYDGWTPCVRRHIIYTARVFFKWLQHNGIKSLNGMDSETIRRYIIERAKSSVGIGLSDVIYSLKRLLLYLHSRGTVSSSLSAQLAVRTRLHKRLLPAFTSDEVSLVFNGLRKRTSRASLRNLAIMLLGRKNGLRASDIANLKLTDIDWRNGEIRLTQKKTGIPIALPLLEEVGQAIKDYILLERKSKGDLVFASARPALGERKAISVSTVFYKLSRSIGMKREKFDGKSFHAFRRTLGRDLVTAGVEASTISQVLGHTSNIAVGQYINLDSKNLKGCALDFANIELSERSIFHV